MRKGESMCTRAERKKGMENVIEIAAQFGRVEALIEAKDKRIADLEATVSRQREFIEKYAFHQPDCPVLRYTSTIQVHECQCGYTQGMKNLEGEA